MSDTDIIIKYVAEHFQVRVSEVSIDTHLFDDLEADSLDSVELVLDMEREFDIEIPDVAIDEVKTVQDIVTLVQDLS
jgi:acyl carrier protein